MYYRRHAFPSRQGHDGGHVDHSYPCPTACAQHAAPLSCTSPSVHRSCACAPQATFLFKLAARLMAATDRVPKERPPTIHRRLGATIDGAALLGSGGARAARRGLANGPHRWPCASDPSYHALVTCVGRPFHALTAAAARGMSVGCCSSGACALVSCAWSCRRVARTSRMRTQKRSQICRDCKVWRCMCFVRVPISTTLALDGRVATLWGVARVYRREYRERDLPRSESIVGIHTYIHSTSPHVSNMTFSLYHCCPGAVWCCTQRGTG